MQLKQKFFVLNCVQNCTTKILVNNPLRPSNLLNCIYDYMYVVLNNDQECISFHLILTRLFFSLFLQIVANQPINWLKWVAFIK